MSARGFLALCALSTWLPACVTDGGTRELGTVVSDRFGGPVRLDAHERAGGEAPAEVTELLRQPLTPSNAARVALLNNRDFRATMAQLGIASAALTTAAQLPNPTVSATYQWPLGAGNQNVPALIDFDALIDVRSLVLLAARRGAADAEVRSVRLDLAARALDLAYRAEAEWYAYVAAQQLMEVRRTALQALGASYEAARLLAQAGNIPELDRAQQEADYQQARLELVESENDERQQRERLNVVLGVWGEGAGWQAEPRLPALPDADADLDDLEGRAVERSLRIAALRERLGADQGHLRVANAAGWLPALEAGVAAAQHEGILFSGAAVRVGIPLFSHGQGEIALREAEMQRDQAMLAAEGVRVRAATRAAHQQLVFARERARFYRDVQLPLRARLVEQALQQYNAMQIGIFQLLQIRRAQIAAGAEYVEALRDYWVARAALARILAGGSAAMESGSGTMDGGTSQEAGQ